MLGYDAQAGRLKHYRVDKMTDVSSVDKPREGKSAFAEIDMAQYSKQVFGMFTGRVQSVKLRFENSLVGAVIGRFGKDVLLTPEGDGYFTFTADVAVSPQFYSWVFAFGSAAEILSPEDVRAGFLEKINETVKIYDK